ncbi:hypothetical protein VP01_622g3 [Puccinia sorghi]|uniref:Phosphoribosyltransferase domain-containing protein n=1 Tax=Puccinia sorghi TaxID=27349 RepID=A0A0L6UHD0_9BASI|nr:hypothetical protein VP01_622g3 [Puccinia sorghi]
MSWLDITSSGSPGGVLLFPFQRMTGYHGGDHSSVAGIKGPLTCSESASRMDSSANVLRDEFEDLHISSHPVLKHKMSKIRDKETLPAEFRKLLKDISFILAVEASRDLETKSVPGLQSPVAPYTGVALEARIGISPILRAGIGMTDGKRLCSTWGYFVIRRYSNQSNITKSFLKYLKSIPYFYLTLFLLQVSKSLPLLFFFPRWRFSSLTIRRHGYCGVQYVGECRYPPRAHQVDYYFGEHAWAKSCHEGMPRPSNLVRFCGPRIETWNDRSWTRR